VGVLRGGGCFEFLRVSKALVYLQRLAAAFERGELSWSLVRALTRVAAEETEGEWLEFLEGRNLDGVKPPPEQAILFLMLRVLETNPEASTTAGRAERERSPFTVVFHRCPGLPWNTSAMRRALFHREGGRWRVANRQPPTAGHSRGARARERTRPGARRRGRRAVRISGLRRREVSTGRAVPGRGG
jgi:hypothetical protein